MRAIALTRLENLSTVNTWMRFERLSAMREPRKGWGNARIAG